MRNEEQAVIYNGHDLYQPHDFRGVDTEDNATARLVIEGGLAICKACGKGEIDLDEPCGEATS